MHNTIPNNASVHEIDNHRVDVYFIPTYV